MMITALRSFLSSQLKDSAPLCSIEPSCTGHDQGTRAARSYQFTGRDALLALPFQFLFGVIFFLMIAISSTNADELKEMSKGVFQGSYSNWPKAVYLRLPDPKVQAVIVPNFGGRILNFSLDGDNILFDSPASGTNIHFGGYQCDIGPEMRELPLHPKLTTGIMGWQHKPYQIRVLSDPDEVLGVATEKEFILDRDSGALAISQRMKNTSTTNVSYCLWDRTVCRGGGFAVLPLNKKSRFKQRWNVSSVYNGAFVFDGSKYVSLHVQPLDDMLIAYCDSEPTKVGADSDAEWIAYIYGDLMFVKYFPFFADGNYSDGGNSVELYFDRDVAELQVLSPEVQLAPGENYSLPEKWILIRLDEPVGSFKAARKAVKKIPPSPFKK